MVLILVRVKDVDSLRVADSRHSSIFYIFCVRTVKQRYIRYTVKEQQKYPHKETPWILVSQSYSHILTSGDRGGADATGVPEC
jgi:hypothetical protein